MTALVHRVRTLVLRIYRRLAWLPPLLARLLVGSIFLRTGYGKLTHFEKIVGFFASLHIPAPAFNAALASTSELVCGGLILIGLLTRLAPIPLVVVMLVALKTAVLPDLQIHGLGDVIQLFTHEEVHYLLLLVWLAIAGAGPVSLDALLAKRLCKAPAGAAPSRSIG